MQNFLSVPALQYECRNIMCIFCFTHFRTDDLQFQSSVCQTAELELSIEKNLQKLISEYRHRESQA